jgi:hypothetical protein
MCPIFIRHLESVEAQRMAAIFCLLSFHGLLTARWRRSQVQFIKCGV